MTSPPVHPRADGFDARSTLPRRPGLYWIRPPAVGFPVRVFLHRYPRTNSDPSIELTASGKRVTAHQALLAGWEWFRDKPVVTEAPVDPGFVRAMALGKPEDLGNRSSAWEIAGTALRETIRRASTLPCSCRSGEPTRTEEGWEEFQAELGPADLCLGCQAKDAIRKAVAAERESGPPIAGSAS